MKHKKSVTVVAVVPVISACALLNILPVSALEQASETAAPILIPVTEVLPSSQNPGAGPSASSSAPATPQITTPSTPVPPQPSASTPAPNPEGTPNTTASPAPSTFPSASELPSTQPAPSTSPEPKASDNALPAPPPNPQDPLGPIGAAQGLPPATQPLMPAPHDAPVIRPAQPGYTQMQWTYGIFPQRAATFPPQTQETPPNAPATGQVANNRSSQAQPIPGAEDWVSGYLQGDGSRREKVAAAGSNLGVMGADNTESQAGTAQTAGNVARGISLISGPGPLLLFTGCAVASIAVIVRKFVETNIRP